MATKLFCCKNTYFWYSAMIWRVSSVGRQGRTRPFARTYLFVSVVMCFSVNAVPFCPGFIIVLCSRRVCVCVASPFKPILILVGETTHYVFAKLLLVTANLYRENQIFLTRMLFSNHLHNLLLILSLKSEKGSFFH